MYKWEVRRILKKRGLKYLYKQASLVNGVEEFYEVWGDVEILGKQEAGQIIEFSSNDDELVAMFAFSGKQNFGGLEDV